MTQKAVYGKYRIARTYHCLFQGERPIGGASKLRTEIAGIQRRCQKTRRKWTGAHKREREELRRTKGPVVRSHKGAPQQAGGIGRGGHRNERDAGEGEEGAQCGRGHGGSGRPERGDQGTQVGATRRVKQSSSSQAGGGRSGGGGTEWGRLRARGVQGQGC
ncbi:hypothetical protein B0H13DRAFT_2065106 [Mycena leptocephala]|nr:hypothetical protein B0H13DRAFT_2065106 [Mycena leptocephala]